MYVPTAAHSSTESVGELLPNFGTGRLIPFSCSSNDYASRHAITMGPLSGFRAMPSISESENASSPRAVVSLRFRAFTRSSRNGRDVSSIGLDRVRYHATYTHKCTVSNCRCGIQPRRLKFCGARQQCLRSRCRYRHCRGTRRNYFCMRRKCRTIAN